LSKHSEREQPIGLTAASCGLSGSPCGGTGKARQPTGCGIAFDNAFAHGFTKGFIHYRDLCSSLVAVLRFDGAMNPFDQSSQTRLGFDVTGALF
jgi:hypothetical protein